MQRDLRLRLSGARLILPTAATNIGVTAGAALGGVLIARGLGPEGRGTLAGVVAWFVLVQVLAEAGVQGATAYFAAKGDTDRLRLVRRSSWLLAAQAILTGSAALICVWAMDLPNDWSQAFTLLMFGLAPVLWLSGSLFALQGIQIGAWNLARVSQVPVYVGTLLVLTVTTTLTVLTSAAAIVGSNIVAGIVAWVLARYLVRRRSPGYEVPSYKRIYGFALPNLAWMLPTIVNGRLDQLAMSVLLPTGQLGQYAVALTLTSLTVPLVASIGNVLLPVLSRREGEDRASAMLGKRAVRWAAIIALMASLAIAVVSRWVVPFLFGQGFEDVPALVWLLVPATVAFATKWVAADILKGMGHPGRAARAEWVGLILNMPIVIAATMTVGAAGAALSQTLGSLAALALMWRWLSSRQTVSEGRRP